VNKGWELSLAYNFVDKTDGSFTVSGNVSHNDNMLEDFGGALDAGTIRGQGLSLAYAQRLAGGHPLFSYHVREFEGFDSNGQPVGDNQTFVGKTALPTWNMGLSLNGRYKAFDLAIYFSGQFGHYIYSNTRNAFFTAGSIQSSRNVTKDVLTSGESGTAEAAVSTRFLEKGDFVRMQNFTLGYNFNVENITFLKKFRAYVTGQNLFVITDYSGLDPEVSSSPANFDLLNELPTLGIDYTAYPRPRTFTIGIIASF
jgi:iron complex outermembrane receptor protein